MKDLRIEGTSDIEELKILGDWAYMRNRLTVTVLTEGGEPMLRRTGYTLSILRKEPDRRWMLARDANLLGKQS
jgi:ketosteroid isomerase-like protein